MANLEHCVALIAILSAHAPLTVAAELVLPENRNVYFAREAVEIAVAGLPAGTTAKVEFVPKERSAVTIACELMGDGSTVVAKLPPYSLAPGVYSLKLDGKESASLQVTSGTNVSTMLLSQTIGWNDLKKAGANFALGNAFSFGLLSPDGKPLTDGLRGRRSAGFNAFEQAMGMDLPTICYMYWTGYVTHKPWGSEKSWADPRMVETMRLFNFHTAQRLRRYREGIISVGCLDEPGLAWGKTPAGGMASGFPNWDEREWYESRGWRYTDDIASRDAADWMRYMAVRCAILKENMDQAKRDLKTVWPEMLFSTDLYAPQAVMDGTDPMNQEVNEVPSTHVFMDWGYGKLGVIGALYLEKAHQPEAKIAHAMNGQLFGKPVPQPRQRDAYRAMLNGMLAVGLKSNWWLNTGGMSPEDLAGVNEPGQRLGPLFLGMSPAGHDVAVLWSFTELSLREREIAAKEAQKKTGEQIKLMIASLPENTAMKEGQLDINAYSVGGNYKEQVLSVHQALSRAGYPAHIVDERLLASGVPSKYKTVVVVGQTFDLPMFARQALRDFSNAGGQIIIDRTTTAIIADNVRRTEADFKDPAYRWTPLFVADKKSFKTPREASYFQTNYFMDELVRKAVEPLTKTMRETNSRPVIVTDSPHLAVERHTGGEGQLLMVLNGFERLPDIGENDEHFIYNYAPYEARYTMQGIDPKSVVYLIEGTDWRKTKVVTDFNQEQTASFAPGEMKLYLVAPCQPSGVQVSAQAEQGSLKVSATLANLKMPWPLEVTVSDANGKAVYHVYRATDEAGKWQETFPLGCNSAAGKYTLKVADMAAGIAGQAKVDYGSQMVKPAVMGDRVRVFDQAAIAAFLQSKPDLRIAIGSSPVYKQTAEKLKSALATAGLRVEVVPEGEIMRKVRYPRVWDPYIKLYQPTGLEQNPSGEVKQAGTIETADDGRQIVRTADGKESEEWRKPGTHLTVVGKGFIDFDAEKFYEPGCLLFVGDNNQPSVLKGEPVEVRATEEVRQKWSRPWTRLNSFVGTDKLCPQLPEAYSVESHLILLGDSKSSELVAALQASELLPQVADEKYPGPGKALVSFAWSPFAVEKNAILIAASDEAGLTAGIERVLAAGKK